MFSRCKFYLILIKEAIFFPVLTLFNYLRLKFGRLPKNEFIAKIRKPTINQNLLVNIHEWGGYGAVRNKKIKGIEEFECGLKFQLERFEHYKGINQIDIWITISNADLLNYSLEKKNIIEVPNEGMDFSGYSCFFNKVKDMPNQYVLLTNTSVNSLQCDFVDDYIEYMESNRSVGLLGISYNTKMHQSLIRNNFNPHIQSFFLLTTIGVLNEAVEKNGGFPGVGIDHKLLLIREGEVGLSNLILGLNYDLACVLNDGEVYKFNKSCKSDNGRKSWTAPFGDYRLHSPYPNAINSIKSSNNVRFS